MLKKIILYVIDLKKILISQVIILLKCNKHWAVNNNDAKRILYYTVLLFL